MQTGLEWRSRLSSHTTLEPCSRLSDTPVTARGIEAQMMCNGKAKKLLHSSR